MNAYQPAPRPPGRGRQLRTLLLSAGITVLLVVCLLAAGFAALVANQLINPPTATPAAAVAAPTRVPTRVPTRMPTAAATATARPTAQPTALPYPALRDLVQRAYRRDDGPITATLTHQLNNNIKARLADIDPQRDLTARATFVNPYNAADHPFDMGFLFRTAPAQRFVLAVLSDQTYRLEIIVDGNWTELARGPISGLRLAGGERNTLELEAAGSTGTLSVNGSVQARLNLSDHLAAGSVSAAIGMYQGQEREGAVTQVEDFSVRGRDEPAPLTVLLRESFVSDQPDFPLGAYSDRNGLLERAVVDGRYQWDYRTVASTLMRSESSVTLPDDFAAAATVQLVSATADDGSALSVKPGIAFRLSRDADGNLAHYLFHVAADGSAAYIYLYRNGEWTQLLSVSDPPYRPGAANQLAVIGRGQRYRCFVNGTEVMSISNFTLSGGGLALTFEVGAAGSARVTFDDVEVRGTP
jgi:hypothetical protein